MKAEFTIKTKLWKYSGQAAWYFVTVNKTISSNIKQIVKGNTKGFGSVRVKVRIGKETWDTSIFPSREKEYMLPVKASVRKANNLSEGDVVTVSFYLVGF